MKMKTGLSTALLVLALLLSAILPISAGAQALSQYFPETGFTVADTEGARFLTEFRRFGGIETLGYPISQPFEKEGFTYQAFQRAALQWRPELGQALLANSMDWLNDAGHNPYLLSLGIPNPEPGTPGIDFPGAVVEREAWLTDEAIALAYRSGGGMERFGLPSSHPVQAGPFVVQRFQRYVFQHWTESVPGMPPVGSVVGVLVGDLLVRAGIVPDSATTPGPAPAPGPAAPPSASQNPTIEVAGGIQFSVLGSQRSRGELLNRPEPGMEFLVVSLAVENQRAEVWALNPWKFKVLDSNEVRRDYAFYTSASLGIANLEPGAKVEGTLAFEVPTGDPAPHYLVVEPDSAWNGRELLLRIP